MLPPERASGAAARPAGRARLSALHRGSCRGDRTPALAQAALHASENYGRYPHHHSCLSEAPRAPVAIAGGDDARTARERGDKPRSQEPHPPRQSAVTGRRPSWASFIHVTISVTKINKNEINLFTS